jgi:LppP/LprE lipoprotein
LAQPRPYIAVSSGGEDTVIVQYQWRQGQDQPCCPTGIATVRFQIGENGKLKAIDPIPNP